MCRIGNVRTLRAIQFPEDAGPLAHPVQPQSYLRIDNFYTATVYNKGAEVIRMLHTLLPVGDEIVVGIGRGATRHDRDDTAVPRLHLHRRYKLDLVRIRIGVIVISSARLKNV